MQTVLLCAEGDELELVGLVHRARQRGLELEVVAGVDASEEPMLFAMQRTNPGLFVLVRTGNLTSDRARDLKVRFSDSRVSEQHLLALKFDPDRIDDMVEGIRRRILRADQAVPHEEATGSMRMHGDSLDPMFTPLIDRAELASIDPDVTERHNQRVHSAEEETTRSVVQYSPKDGKRRPRQRPVLWLAIGAGLAAAVIAGGWFAYQSYVTPQTPAENGTTADVPEAEPNFPRADVRVPTVEDGAPAESQTPAKPHLRRRTTPRSGH
jgi:hypothetical protein